MKANPKSYRIPADVLVTLLEPDATFDQRKAAIMRLAVGAWEHGWEQCTKAHAEALAATLPLLSPDARA
jgi:hypothetical protein